MTPQSANVWVYLVTFYNSARSAGDVLIRWDAIACKHNMSLSFVVDNIPATLANACKVQGVGTVKVFWLGDKTWANIETLVTEDDYHRVLVAVEEASLPTFKVHGVKNLIFSLTDSANQWMDRTDPPTHPA